MSIDVDNIEFLSDDDTTNANEENNSVTTISTIFDTIKNYISDNDLLSNLHLIVEIIEIRDYNGMVFLKIKDDTSTISAVIYKFHYKNVIKSGDKMKIVANITLFRGQLQLVIQSYEKMGLGDDSTKLAALKNKLSKKGYFDKKLVLENNYNSIGVISSINAAGFKDFLDILTKRCCNKKIYIYPSTVQGKSAPKEIINAINLANRHDIAEVLVLIRGGGSKEDLECFNSEELAHSIHQSSIPMVTGIGHQIDISIADLVCTKSFITPTAVAQNITLENINSQKNLKELIDKINQKIFHCLDMHYNYLIAREKKLLGYQIIIIDDLSNNLATRKHAGLTIQKNILGLINNRHEYIHNSNIQLIELMIPYSENLTKSMTGFKNSFTAKIENIGFAIELYDSRIKIFSKPKILDSSNKEIVSVKQMITGKKYKICFADGVFNINL